MGNRKIAPFTIDGKTIWVEVEEIEIVGEQASRETMCHPRDLRSTATPTNATDKMKTVVSDIGETLEALVGKINKGLDNAKPAEWTVEMNIGFAGEKNIPFLAKGSIEGGLKVSATWKNDTSKGSKPA